MDWKMFAIMAAVIVAATGSGYYDGGPDGAMRYFLISACGTGAGYCVGRLLTKGD